MHTLEADLHCHSTHSDGTLSPAALAERAHARGVRLWALTDHDDLSGLDEASRAARACGLAFVPGVEVSVSYAGETVHIVGLRIDPTQRALRDGLARTRDGRLARAEEMAAGLAAAGYPGALEGALRYVHNPSLVSRTHFARWLVETGTCANVGDVFRRFLVEGKPGFVAHRWAALDEAVAWIHRAGGIAIVAHPKRYRLAPAAMSALFDDFVRAGGRGVEVVTPAHDAAARTHYADLARRRGLLASRGSDFHAPDEGAVDFGALPPLPRGVQPVWQGWPEAWATPSLAA